MYTACRLTRTVKQTTANDNQRFVTNQVFVVLKEFKIKVSAFVTLLYTHYASTYPGLSSGIKLNCQN